MKFDRTAAVSGVERLRRRTSVALAAILLATSVLVGGAEPVGGAKRDPVLLGAGDIASCKSSGDKATADLLGDLRGTIFTVGDNAYPDGSDEDFEDCYDPTWGQYKKRTRPSVGNHEYETSDASGYFDYFRWRAGPRGKGYYSYDLGKWHIVVLNSNCEEVSCGKGSKQVKWLRADLAKHRTRCTLAYWHHPRWSSGHGGSDASVQPFWKALDEYGADVVLAGHSHHYERFARMNKAGKVDRRGIRSFVVGTGGAFHTKLDDAEPNSQVRDNDTFGVLALTLRPRSYSWKFVPVAGKKFSDSGWNRCF